MRLSTGDGRLRVAFLDSIRQWGGGQKWCLETAGALIARGHEVLVAGVANGALCLRARDAGVPTHALRAGLPGTGFLAAPGLTAVLRRRGVEAVVANVGRDLRLGALACLPLRTRLLQRRGLLRRIRPGPVNRLLYGRLVAKIIVNCRAIRDRMREGAPFLPPERFAVVPNGIDTSRPRSGDGAAFRAELGVAAEAPLATVVARLAAMKGHDHLLAAWPAVLAQVPGAVLAVVGEGEREEPLRRLAGELNIADRVRFAGFRADPGSAYRATDVFVLPSVRDEGMSNALLEAQWHGCPAVVTDCGGLSEVVVEGETGRVVPPADPAALARALGTLLSDEASRRTMGRAARTRIDEHFSLAAATRSLEDLLLGLRPPRAPA